MNFSEVCPKNILTTYLPTIIAKLESILAAKFKEVISLACLSVVEHCGCVRISCESQDLVEAVLMMLVIFKLFSSIEVCIDVILEAG